MTAKKNLPKDPDLANVEKALKRAGKAARALAKKTHTPCYVIKEGKIVNVAEGQAGYRTAKKSSGRTGENK
jgi:diaminopimelate decarboxylase